MEDMVKKGIVEKLANGVKKVSKERLVQLDRKEKLANEVRREKRANAGKKVNLGNVEIKGKKVIKATWGKEVKMETVEKME